MKKRRGPLSEAAKAANAVVRHAGKHGGDLGEAQMERVKQRARAAPAEMHEALWTLYGHQRSAVRMVGVQMADELFGRSAEFRRLLVSNLRAWCALCMGTDVDRALPGDGGAAELRTVATSVLHSWHQRFVPRDPSLLPASTTDFRRQLDIVYRHLQDKLNVQFDEGRNQIVNPVAVRRVEGTRAAARREMLEYAESVTMALDEIENGIAALFPTFEERFQEPAEKRSKIDNSALMLQVELPDFEEDEAEMRQEEEEWEDVPVIIQGVNTNDYAINISFQTMADESHVFGRVVKEALQVLRRNYLPKMRHWAIVLADDNQAVQFLARAEMLLEQSEKLIQ